jgi:hypothetical protein
MGRGRKSGPNRVKELLKKLRNWTGWEIQTNRNSQLIAEGGSVAQVFYLDRHIAVFQFSQQMAVIGDAFGTNHFNIPVLVVIAPDCDMCNQPGAFGYSFNLSENSIKHFRTVLETLAPGINMFRPQLLTDSTSRYP